ncbi:ABC transporter G family member 28-like [Carex rostrata]
MMRRKARSMVLILITAAILSLGRWPVGQCQAEAETDNDDDYDRRAKTASNSLVASLFYSKIRNMTRSFSHDTGQQLDYCIKDSDKDWNEAFNFSSDLTFVTNCMKETNGDLGQRVCTAAEMKFYFNSFNEQQNYLKPNLNCNLTSWVEGCEPGWGCSSGDQKINMQDSKTIPLRTLDCRPCCAGFFCPHGLTCMIPCPLGSYCPKSTLNKTTGICDPYNYQLSPGRPNHTCGSADAWADVVTTGHIFCPAGYYCPSTIKKISCSSGYYCRKGSTKPAKCIWKRSCKENSENQDITIFGVLLIIIMSAFLLVIYNFSGQILTQRERREAKSREAAVRRAKENAQSREARERWKTAKDVAKKHASELPGQLRRTFSRTLSHSLSRAKSVRDQPKTTGSGSGSTEAAASPSKPPTAAGLFGKKKDSNSNSLTNLVKSIDQDPDKQQGLDVTIGDKNLKKNMPKGKAMHSRTQIFSYAYGQIEREKAMQEQNKNLTFSGVISMASDMDIRTRPFIEVTFKDLTLMLKGSKKRLLRSVTGQLRPGRIAAVMGPSGAGKTTFLNAVAGKATGCETSGMVLINGKIEPLRAYKKIIGFVPQDDIVHGNLTVEENLWFSARCRLSADMSKADKVLVVERVIESLGLQPVRDSLVGTVEKRGISGGQRKRVNVGLEMVMEPSLLILDEPTSGLDSSSSQLLLRALRREAMEGVNICMVVHQPSYDLFQKFDDLILLAKGGMLVYLGAVKKVEEYFSHLGIVVPDRINPPDYFIDILEGIIKPSASTGVTAKELPLRWMLHNGYDVPRDMLESSSESDSIRGIEKSTSEDMWDSMKDMMGQRKEEYQYQFDKSTDLSNRRTSGLLQQYRYFLGRVGKQRLREARIQGVDYLILCLAGICLGTLAKVSDETFGALGYTYTVIAVSLLCKIGALRSFSLDKLHYWRERASGMSSLAYFLSKDTVDHFNTLVKPIVYLSMFYFFNNPRSSIFANYLILIALVYCVTGIAYTFAICFQPGSAQLWSALVPVVLTLIATQQNASKVLADLCYTKWALEAFVIANAQRYSGVWLITRCGSLKSSDYDINDWILCIIVLVAYGIVFRCIAFFSLITFQRK